MGNDHQIRAAMFRDQGVDGPVDAGADFVPALALGRANLAGLVVQVIAGLPQVLKGKLP